ncbi:hypothetical protein F4780DRAFT_490832 [Xylariomycetidae sp. FL0641]|nr:hypothetical protein F4780DRAFT_490832 [Xylariomycetidae sp. FL0641]
MAELNQVSVPSVEMADPAVPIDPAPNIKQEEDSSDQAPNSHNSNNAQGPVVTSALTEAESESPTVTPGELPQSSQRTHADIFPCLQATLDGESAKTLDQHRTEALKILKDISRRLDSATSCIDTTKRLESVNTLVQQAKSAQTVIGVVGSTGQGKSSMINALLGESELLPTNCVRACTAVVTEVSWNASEDPEQAYTAEIEFISKEEWMSELRHLFQDAADPSGEVSSDTTNTNTDAGVAWAKMKAVYPKMTRDSLGDTNAEDLASMSFVKPLLGTTKTLHKPNAKSLHAVIQRYVDSKEKSKQSSSGPEQEREYWPLIKVVRIRTKADVLSTGAILVDLPGVADSNAARAAIAGKYIEKCDAIWVVASIVRAIDDKAPQDLLGQSFKRQLKFDGTYSKITFICSKTDDVLIDEASMVFGLDKELEDLQTKQNTLFEWQSTSSEQLAKDSERLKSLSTYNTQLDKHLEQWEKARVRQSSGQEARAPKEINTTKRKAPPSHLVMRKRLRSAPETPVDEASLRYTAAADYWDNLQRDIPKFEEKQLITEEDTMSMMEFLRAQKVAAVEEMEHLEQRSSDEEVRGLELEEASLDAESRLVSLCISKRNDYSRDAIRESFALGLKQLDDLDAQRDDPETFDPDEEVRDYDLIASSLPIFCVCSRAYQALIGKLSTRSNLEGFDSAETTEIPQLVQHAKNLTEAIRMKENKVFLNNALQVLNSLYIWSSEHDFESDLTEEEKQSEMLKVKDSLAELEEGLRVAIGDFFHGCNKILQKRLFDRFDKLTRKAANRAPTTAAKWSSKDGRGLHCNTYRAVCRRRGDFSSRAKPINFNEELVTPLTQGVADAWELVFERKIPRALDTFATTSQNLLQEFRGSSKKNLVPKATYTTKAMLQSQLKARAEGITYMISSFKQEATAMQRDASRGFVEAIQQGMIPIYDECANDHGRGVYARIEKAMLDELRTNGFHIMSGAPRPVTQKLTNMCDKLQTDIEGKVAALLDGLTSDYRNVILGRDVTAESKPIREEIAELLETLDGRFAP